MDALVFFFGRPQVDEDTGELFELDTEGIDKQTEELGTFLYDEIEVSCVVVPW